MTPVRILREALEDLRTAARYYETEQAGLGRALTNGCVVRINTSPSGRWHRTLNAATFGSGQLAAFLIESIIEYARTNSL